jgi:Rha family phage regulatory protein
MNAVQITTQDITKAVPITTSVIVAEYFEKRHDHVMRDVKTHLEGVKDLPKSGGIFYVLETTYQDQYGREQTMYEMNEAFWMLLVMGYTGKKALTIKHEFIKQFQLMKSELLARQNTRHIGVAVRHSITAAIKDHVAETGNFKKFAYSNYTKLVYKFVIGADVKKTKEARGLKETDNLRDFLTMEELEKVQAIESKIAAFIEVSDTEGKDDRQVYQMVKDWIVKQRE